VLRTSLAIIAITASAMLASPTQAQTKLSAFAEATEETSVPIGWVDFCRQPENKADCSVPRLRATTVELNEKLWATLLSVNARVNREIEPVTDIDHWGVVEKWSYPTDGKGDCEDYVLEKRKRLMAAGFPRQSLLITVVRDKKGDGHAVLMVKTDRGDFILDNFESRVLLWTDTGFRFLKRQSQEDPHRWVSLGAVDTAIMTAKNR
jgi:predicted transglutaminase-like cysteine proteinase